MSSDKKVRPNFALFILFILFLMLFFHFVDSGEGMGRARQLVGKSNVTIYTADVSSYGLDVPEEYEDQVAMIQFSDNEPIEGETITINATVFNVGTRGASITVYFYDGPPLDNDLIGTDTLSVNPLGYDLASTPWNTTSEEEFHTIHVILDPDDPSNESDDENNNATRDIVVNQIPIANANLDLSLPQELFEDDEIKFDGTSSSDTESDLAVGLTYSWLFNDPYANSSNPDNVSGLNLTRPTHIFTNQGAYQVNLTVEDDGGARAEDSILVTISNVQPTAIGELSKDTVDEDEVITFNSDASLDTASDRQNLQYFWNFGNGENSGWINTTSLTYSYPAQNTYSVELIVQDDNDLTDSDNLEVIVNNVLPIADIGDDYDEFGNIITFNASDTWDTPSDLKKIVYYWDFGDGSFGYGLEVSHEFQKKGRYLHRHQLLVVHY